MSPTTVLQRAATGLPVRYRATFESVAPWLAASLILVVAHFLAGLVWRKAMLVSAIGIGGQALIMGHYAVHQARLYRQKRGLWLLLSTAMLFWALAYAAIFMLRDVLFADDTRALIDSVLFMARGAALLLIVTSGIDEDSDSRTWRLDIAQAGIYIAAIGLLMLGSPWAENDPLPAERAHSIRVIQNVALALLAAGVALLRHDRPDAAFFWPVAAMLLAYVASSTFVNQVFIISWDLPPGSSLFVLSALPMLVFFVARGLPPPALPKRLSRLCIPVGLIAPATLPAATLVIVLTERLRGDPVGPALGIAALLLYGWRMVSIQLRHRRSIDELAAAHSHAAGLSLIDPLTTLGNRRSFERALAMTSVATTSAGDSEPVTLLMIDADWFKAYNDSLGHGAGDMALRRIAAALSDCAPPDSAIARLGGEEFAILARISDPDAGARLGERVRSAVASLDIAHARSPLGRLTVSVGVATQAAGNPEALMAAADRALYAAKHSGRNRVCVAESDALAA